MNYINEGANADVYRHLKSEPEKENLFDSVTNINHIVLKTYYLSLFSYKNLQLLANESKNKF